jgi:hypothetical protein
MRSAGALKLPYRLADRVKQHQLPCAFNVFFYLELDFRRVYWFVAYDTDLPAPIAAPHANRRLQAGQFRTRDASSRYDSQL